MKLLRRNFLHLAAGAAALSAASRFAWAQAYPARPVRIIVGFSAGGPTDIVARVMAQWLSERLGHQFVVENRAGAASNIGTEAALRSPPDGYTLLQVTSSNAVNATFYENLSFDFINDIAPVGAIIRVPFVMEVNPSVPARTVPEFIAYAKANPGRINMASGGTGTSIHICRRALQDDGRDQPRTCALSRLGACTHRHDRRSGPRHVRRFDELDRAHSIGRLARACGDDRDALPSAAGHYHRGRFFAGL